MAFFGTSVGFSGLFGPLSSQPSGFQTQIIGVGSSLLAAAIDSKQINASLLSLSAADRASINLRGPTDAVIPPWKLPEQTKTLNQQVREVRQLTKFIDLKAKDLKNLSNDVDTQATFAIYKALSNIRILADYASQTATSTASLGRLDQQFQAGLNEVRSFLSTAQLDKLDLFLGEKQYKAETSTRTGKNSTGTNASLINSNPNAAITGLTGTEVFTVSITKSGATDNISIDLSGLTGTLSLNNVKDYINTQIAALTILDSFGNPVPKNLTRFDVHRDGTTGKYGLQIDGTLTEEVKLSAAVAAPTLYVASSVSQLDTKFATTSRITEVNNLSAALTIDDTTSFAAVDYQASQINKLVDATKATTLDPKISALRDKFRATALATAEAAALAAGTTSTATPVVDNTLSITNVDSAFKVNADTNSSRVAVDSEGGIYVVGTSTGSFDHQLNTATGADVFLSKFDTEGNVVFSRLLGVSGDAKAYGITVDSNDNVIVVGKTDSALSTADVIASDTINTSDAFVTKVSKRGDEIFRYQLDKFGASAAYSVAVDSNNDIFVGGYTKSAISITSGFSGGKDALILKLSGVNGALTDSNVFGTSADEVIKGIAVDASNNLVVATESAGNAVVYRIDGTNLTNQTSSLNYGSLGIGGSVQGIAIDNVNNEVYVTGITTNASLNAAGAATVNETAKGGFEGFVSGLNLVGTTSLTADFTTYLSTTGTDHLADVVVDNQVVYVAGTTSDALPGEIAKGATDSFVARVNGATGVLEDINQFGEGLARQTAGGLAFTKKGNSVLEILGLPTGTIAGDQTLNVQTQTTSKVGDFFYLSIDGGKKKKITLQDGDTFNDLKRKVRIAGFGKLTATISGTAEGSKLEISALDAGVPIDILPGTGGRDLLKHIGLTPGKLLPKDVIFGLNGSKTSNVSADPNNLGGSFALGLDGALHIKNKATAKYVLGLLDKAITNTQRAFRSLTYDPLKAQLLNNKTANGPVPQHLQNQLANFQSGLARLQSGSSSPSVSLLA